jgi:hypothetical protein
MKIRTEPLLGGTAFSFIVLLITSIISLFFVMNMMRDMMAFLTQAMANPNVDPGMPFSGGMYGILALMSCIIPIIAGIGSGLIYAKLHAKEEPITGSLISGGAASGALGFFLAGIVGSFIGGVMMIPLMNQFTALGPGGAGLPGPVMSMSLVTTIFSSICSGILYAVYGAVLGAIGAAIGGSSAKKASAQKSPA